MHTSQCANSTSTRCKCSCGGSLHGFGGPTTQGPWPNSTMSPKPSPSPAGGGVADWTDRASELIASVFVDAGGDLDAALVQEVAGGVQRTVEAALTDLPSVQQQELRERLGWHLICGLLAMAV